MVVWVKAGRRLVAIASLLVLGGCAAAGSIDRGAPIDLQSPLGSYLAARHAQQEHDYADAGTFLERALAADPGNYDLVRRTFVLRVSEGRIAEAVPLAQRIVAIDGRSGLAGLTLMEQDLKLANYDKVAEGGRTMPREGAQRYAVPLLMAWAEAGRQHPAPALQALDGMGDMHGLEPLRDLHVALIDDYLGRVDDAAAAYGRLVGDPAGASLRVVELAGNFYERHGKPDDARSLYERAIARDGTNDIAERGLKRLAAGQVPPSLITRPAQGGAEALFDLATLMNQRETVDSGLVYARLSLDLDPDFAPAVLLIGEMRDEENRPADALELYRKVPADSSLYWTARLRTVAALDALDRTDEAAAMLRDMAAERPDRAEPLIELGDLFRSHKRFAEAVTAYDGAIARTPNLGPRDWRMFYSRGVALERSGEWPRAEADLKQALKLQPEQPLVLNYLGYSWIDKGQNLAEALKMIERAVELRPDDGYIVDSLGWAFYRLGEMTRATQFLERAIELLPEDPTINDHLGDAYWRTGRLVEARYQWSRALQFGPEADEVQGIRTKLDRGLGGAQPVVTGG
jgi:tetratricopeptide (TPR) repeat protein